MEEMLTVRELLAAVIWRWKKVLICGLVFAVLLGAVQAIRLSRGAQASSGDDEATLRAEEEYRLSLLALTEQKENAEAALEQAEDYLENSLLMKINPYRVWTCSAVYAVAGENGEPLRKLTDDTVQHMMEMICMGYAAQWPLADLTQEREGTVYRDTEVEYFRELVTVNADAGLLYVTVLASEKEECQQGFSIVEAYLAGRRETVSSITCPHSLVLMETGTALGADQILAENQLIEAKKVTTQQEALKAQEKALKALKDPRGTNLSPAAFTKSVIKFAVIGGVLGLLLACLLVLWTDIAHRRMEDSYQAERVLSIPFLGNVAKPESGLKRLSQRIAGERLWPNREMAVSYAVERVRTGMGDKKQLLVAVPDEGDIDSESIHDMVSRLESCGIKARIVTGFARDPGAVDALRSCEGVALLLKPHSTGLTAAAGVISDAACAGKPVVGFAMF